MATATALPLTGSNTSPAPVGLLRPGLRRMKSKGHAKRESPENIVTSWVQSPNIEDPLRILAPAQKKLSTVESQRILAVMDEATKRLECALVLPFLADSLHRFSVSLGSELVAMIEEYHKLVGEYNQLCELLESQGTNVGASSDMNLQTSSGTSIRSGGGGAGRAIRLEPLLERTTEDRGDVEEHFHQICHELKHCVKSILRALNKDPATTSILQAAAKERSRTSSQLLESMGSLCGVVNETLLTTRVEEVKREEHLQKVAERQQSAEEQIRRLERELEEALQQKNEEVSQKNMQIKRLKVDINTVIKLAEDANRRVRADASKQQSADEKGHEERKITLQEDIAKHKKKLQEEIVTHREKEQELRKRAFKRESEVENWIQTYDSEMGEKQDELEQLQTEYAEEQKQLKELKEKLEVLTIEYDVVVKEQEEARKKAEEEEKRMKEIVWAVKIIQRVWRSYHERRRQEKQKGKKGKGKGKGKGKAGKGKGKKKKT